MLGEIKNINEDYHFLFENAPLGYHSLDENGCILFVNKKWLSFFGYSKDEVRGKWFGEFLTPQSQEKYKTQFTDFKKRGEVSGVKFEVIKSNGKHAIVFFDGTISYDDAGKFKQTHCIFHDITEQIELKKEIKESEEKYRYLFEESPTPIVLMDLQGRFVELNSKVEQVLGYSKEELIGKRFTRIKIIHPDFLTLTVEYFQKIINEQGTESAEFLYCHKDGHLMWGHTQGTFMKLGNKSMVQFIIQDITKRKNVNLIGLIDLIDDLIMSILKALALFVGASRSSLFILSEDLKTISNTHEWCANPQDSQMMLIQDVPFKTLGYYQKLLLRKETININTINDYPLNAIAEREWIKKHGFRSLLFVPMLSKNKLYGAVGFTGEIGKSIMWPSVFIELLKSISSILISTLESNKAEQKLRESEQKYRELVNNANSIIIKLDKDANIVFINEYGEKFFEYNEAEILGRNVIGTIVSKTESSGRDLQQMVNEVFQYPERFERNENENITKSGKKVWVSWANKAIKDENDKFIGILSVGTDITEKKRTNLKLKESEEKFKNITEQNLMGIIILQDNVIKYTNKAMADIYGYTIEEALNWEPMEFFKFVAPDSLKIAREQALKKQSGDPSQLVQYIIHGVKKSGELIWIDNFSRTINYEGHPADLVVQIDITEKMKAEKIIQNEIVQLKKIDEIKNDLIRRISHELNTPLISIYSTSTMIIDHFSNRLDDDLLSLIQIIKNGGERLKNLFDNLIDVYFIESKQIIIKLKQVNLAIEIKNALEKINSIIVDRRHKVITELPDECLRKIDKVHFKKAITNLLSNAAKFTPPGGIIKIELLETEKNIELRVQDNGIGFTSEEKQTIFTKFGKIERYGKGYDVDIEGPGLGLYLAYELISLNGGKLSLNSEGYNKGSTFIIRFKK